MKSLTKAVFISTLLLAGFVQAAEPVKVSPINIDSLQAVAQNYVAKHMVNIAINEPAQFDQLVLTKTNKQNKKMNASLVVNNRIIAD